MSKWIAVTIVSVAMTGCAGSAGPGGYELPTPSPVVETPKPPTAKAIDIPDLAGRRESEVMGALGGPTSSSKLAEEDTSGETRSDWTLNAGKLYIHFKDGRANYFHFICNSDFPTAAELGNIVGMDLSGATPVSSTNAETTFAGTFSGQEFKEVRALVNGKFFLITARVD